jgi:hypothetical protein
MSKLNRFIYLWVGSEMMCFIPTLGIADSGPANHPTECGGPWRGLMICWIT